MGVEAAEGAGEKGHERTGLRSFFPSYFFSHSNCSSSGCMILKNSEKGLSNHVVCAVLLLHHCVVKDSKMHYDSPNSVYGMLWLVIVLLWSQRDPFTQKKFLQVEQRAPLTSQHMGFVFHWFGFPRKSFAGVSLFPSQCSSSFPLAERNGSLYHTEFGGLIHFSCKS